MNPRLLIVGDERELRTWLRHHVEILWPDATVEEMEPAALALPAATVSRKDLDLIVLGAQCGEAPEDPATGLESLRQLASRDDTPPVVVIASGGNELTAVRAMRLGAADYLPRSVLNAQRLATALRLALRTRRRPPQARPRPARALPRRIAPSHLDLPQYAILHKLGESSRAAVYFAYSITLGRNVALKISKPSVEGAEESREFAREYAAISAVQHRSVVEIYDYGFHAGREFIAMEYFPCGDLKTRLQQPMSVAESLGYALRICGALRIIHGAGLIHRDLKPPNVMLREDGSVVLIDFGLAKGLESSGQNTAIGVLRGSPYYMSPEQAQGIPLDSRSDLYSVGVMLFEMLTGSKPYMGNSAVEVMQQHVHGPRPRLPAPLAGFEPLLEQFMARERHRRFPDAAAACSALMAAIDDLAAQAAPADAQAGEA
ncbi:MAG TPA: protein kinase [Steroidobacteraceae bacterium]|jgi:DNA-binding NarL/FixJ family response regulator|nr:protein kinase [Steroidobacteraceae bacterium]